MEGLKKESLFLYALFVSLINGMLIYALSMQLSSNQYYSYTQFATLYTTCIMFLGHGLGGVLFPRLKDTSAKAIVLTLKIWLAAIVITFVCVFRLFPPAMVWVQSMVAENHAFVGNGLWLKMLVSGGMELPVFLAEGMVYSAILSYARSYRSAQVPATAAFSTFGSALGYLVGIVLPDFPGINAVFAVSVVLLVLLILHMKFYINVLVAALACAAVAVLDVDSAIESFRSKDNQVYANMVGGQVVDYDWSRFQKSEYVYSEQGDRLYLILNGAMQVMESKNDALIRNIGYEIVYGRNYVEGKNVLIIGGGMGRGSQVANSNGAASVDVVDIEPSLKRKYDVYQEYNDIYSHETVHFHVMDGRMALKEFQDKTYDLIVFEGVINEAAVYSLNVTTEGYLYSAQAVKDAVSLLSEDGIFVNYTISSDKTMASFMQAYPELAAEYSMNYVYAMIRDANSGLNYYVSLAGASKNKTVADALETGFAEYVSEGVEITDIENREIVEADDWPITDDRPYPHINSKDEVLFQLLFGLVSAAIVCAICAVGVRRHKATVSYLQFGLLGTAMMMVELYVINKLNFFLGDSMMSYSVGSAIFLVAFALGNAKSVALNFSLRKFSGCFLGALLLFFGVFNSQLREQMLLGSAVLRLIAALALIFPLAFLCGTFFPRLLLALTDEKDVADSMGYIMLMDSFGVCAGFFIFNYVSYIWGFNYTLPIIAALYLIEAVVCYKGRAAI